MISQSKIKLINSLSKKKYREINQLFIAEGEKLVSDLIHSSTKIKWLIAKHEWIMQNKIPSCIEIIETTDQYLKKISQLKTAPSVIAVCEFPSNDLSNTKFKNTLTLVLDDIQDPGNLGTIIRLADWFGIENIICSNNTVDVYNPKVVQATMGAITRINVFYTDLMEFIKKQRDLGLEVYGTFLDGNSIYSQNLKTTGLIVMGNEGNGISTEIETLVTQKLLIPNFSSKQDVSESLNVSTATAITLSEFKRGL